MSTWPTEVPPGWTRCKSHLVLDPVSRAVRPDDEIVTAFRDGTVTLRKNRREDGFTNAAKEIGYQHISKGDLVVHSMDGGFGAIGVADSSGKASPVVHAYRSKVVDVDFVAYFLRAAVNAGWIAANGKGIRQRSTQFDRPALARTELMFPPLDTQRRIADYLDRETAEIDAMDIDLDRLIEVLGERRAAALSDLYDGAPLVPTGAIAQVNLGKMLQSEQKDGADIRRPYLRAAHVQPHGRFDFDVAQQEMWFSPAEVGSLTLEAGDVVIVEGGAGYGRAAYVAEDMPGWGFQNSIVRVRAYSDRSDGAYLRYAFQAAMDRGDIEIAASTATIPHFTAEKVSRFRLPYVPLAKQRRIADHLDRETAEIDFMIEDAKKLKEVLAERRVVLISDVVTGRKEVPA